MRGGVVPGSNPIIDGRLTSEPWSLLFSVPYAWESSEHKPGARERNAAPRLES